MEDEVRLGRWLRSLRNSKRKGTIDMGCKSVLEKLGVVWSTHDM